MKTRIEADSIGSLEVPSDAYYGGTVPAGKTEFSHHGNVDPPGHDPESGEN